MISCVQHSAAPWYSPPGFSFHGIFQARILQWSAIPFSSGSCFVKEESEKAGLKLTIKIAKITASSSITSWQIEEEKLEAMTDFCFLGSKITVDETAAMKLHDACSLKQKL